MAFSRRYYQPLAHLAEPAMPPQPVAVAALQGSLPAADQGGGDVAHPLDDLRIAVAEREDRPCTADTAVRARRARARIADRRDGLSVDPTRRPRQACPTALRVF